VTHAEYLKSRIEGYDAILNEWRKTGALREDIEDLERHRNNVHDWYISARLKRGPTKRVRSEKEMQAFGGLFRRPKKTA
jgi:hypothetical protein